jgi:hypothetical protein
VTLRELLGQLERLDPEAEVLIVDPEEDYEARPYGCYEDLSERLDNESTFAVRAREIEGRQVVEIGSIAPFV